MTRKHIQGSKLKKMFLTCRPFNKELIAPGDGELPITRGTQAESKGPFAKELKKRFLR